MLLWEVKFPYVIPDSIQSSLDMAMEFPSLFEDFSTNGGVVYQDFNQYSEWSYRL